MNNVNMNGNMNNQMNNDMNNMNNVMNYNMGYNMNMQNDTSEQDLILKQKIEKREKIDTILAYILIVILVVCIGIVLYLKFIRKEEPTKPEEYVPTYISLNEISTSLNSSPLANRYLNDAASFSSMVSSNSLVVTYTKEDINLNLNIPMTGSELVVTMPDENKEIATDIYKEITNIICVYYDNDEINCRNTLNNITTENTVEGIRFETNENINNVYINTTQGITVNSEIVYNEVTKTNISDTNYTLNLLDNRISNISVSSDEANIIFSGTIERLTEDNSNLSVSVKLYDASDNLLGENKYEYNEENVLEQTSTFEVSFMLSDALKLEDIVSYSFEIIK